MNKFIVMLLALGLAFVSGWLFGNEVRPPVLDNVALAMWIAVGGVAFLSAAMVAVSR